MRRAGEGVTREGASKEMTTGDASDGRVSGLFSSLPFVYNGCGCWLNSLLVESM